MPTSGRNERLNGNVNGNGNDGDDGNVNGNGNDDDNGKIIGGAVWGSSGSAAHFCPLPGVEKKVARGFLENCSSVDGKLRVDWLEIARQMAESCASDEKKLRVGSDGIARE